MIRLCTLREFVNSNYEMILEFIASCKWELYADDNVIYVRNPSTDLEER